MKSAFICDQPQPSSSINLDAASVWMQKGRKRDSQKWQKFDSEFPVNETVSYFCCFFHIFSMSQTSKQLTPHKKASILAYHDVEVWVNKEQANYHRQGQRSHAANLEWFAGRIPHSLYASIPHRMQIVIKAEGAATKYWRMAMIWVIGNHFPCIISQ